MIYFTAEEIFGSIIYAALYGGGFAAFYVLATFLSEELIMIKYVLKSSAKYDKFFEIPESLKCGDTKAEVSDTLAAILKFSFILLYGVGFILLSYFALDGTFRIYLLAITLMSYWMVFLTLRATLVKILSKIVFLLNITTIYIFRLLLYPFIKIHSLYIKNARNI